MAKVVRVGEEIVEIGMGNGNLIEVRLSDLDFVPRVGDVVQVHNSDEKVKVYLIDPPEPRRAPSVEQDPYAQELAAGKRRVNKVAYILLALFLGGFGVHKFYAGKIVGVVYLIFFWTFIPGIIAFIEGLMAITKPADRYGNIAL